MKNILLIVSIAFTSFVFGQDVPFEKDFFKDQKDGLKEAKKNIKDGDEQFEKGPVFYKDAIAHYEAAQKFNPNYSGLNYKLGVCYLASMFKYKALPFLEKANELNSGIAEDLTYHLGVAYHLDMQFNKAITAYSKYQRVAQADPDPYTLEQLRLRMKQCDNGKKIVAAPIRVFVDNLGDNLNSAYNEYGAAISADESVIVFTARRPGSVGGKIDPGLNENFEDIYIAYKDEKGDWMKAKNAGESVNTSNHDANSGISADGQKFIIYLGKSNGGDLFESTLEGEEWSKPESFGKKVNTDYHESSAAYAPDGKSIYFVSDRPGGKGEHDIYVARIDEKGKWDNVENLGAVINTKYEEEAVFMHPDGKTLYFSSKGHSSMGGYDIFKSIYDAIAKTWSTPVNLGYPVNTPDDDIFFQISASGRHGYYTSMTSDSKGLRDLYVITFLGPEKPMVLNTEDVLLASVAAPVRETIIAPIIEVKEAQLTILKGTISDFLTDEKLQAQIEIVDNEANVVIATFKSNSKSGKYLVSLPAGKNYGIAVKKDGYLFHSENFDIPASSAFQEVTKDVKLKMLSVGNKIVLRNIFFDLNKATLRSESTAELNRLIKLMTDVPTLRIELGGHTDSQGSDTYNMTLSDQRAKAVVDYLGKNGIDSSRLESAGYGETQLVNGCKNGINCSPVQHQENRRTEFKVLSF
ncbi:MAG: outer membrane protein OmpA-like peptidoglycan-associated protein [Flavobacteriaceae bacterium]|jgi:outer membrane protein OmpA-like peptidoglycan-associated protein/tetratricopeptide (TPR) repeat protein